jgi:hypothetical protein
MVFSSDSNGRDDVSLKSKIVHARICWQDFLSSLDGVVATFALSQANIEQMLAGNARGSGGLRRSTIDAATALGAHASLNSIVHVGPKY